MDPLEPPLLLPLLPPLPLLLGRPPEPVPGAAGLQAIKPIESNPAASADVVFVIYRISFVASSVRAVRASGRYFPGGP
jgi:hypothetical protein